LQSFPDWFEFIGNTTSIFNQIGNAVPPLLAHHLARSIRDYLISTIRFTENDIRRKQGAAQQRLELNYAEMDTYAKQ
jgi:DNA (cytosine-5)-methyltransferase 1